MTQEQSVNSESVQPKIIVLGVGGAGGNAVNNMIQSKLEGVEFVVANTDAQALKNSLANESLYLGFNITQGLGAGAQPDIGKASAEESLEKIEQAIKGAHMLFIAAGMGGGTGTGAAPVIARKAREMGILVVGVVTKPFHFEGAQRTRCAELGIETLQQCVDTLIVIPNQNLFKLATEQTTFADAFQMADRVLYSGVRGITDLMIMPGLINLDFADIRTTMAEMGTAMMGTGEASGENRAIQAAEEAIANPLLDETSMRGAKGLLINITGGTDITLFEVDEAANRVREEVDNEAHIIFGSTFDANMQGCIRVSVVATGINNTTNNSSTKNTHTSTSSSSQGSLFAPSNAPVVDLIPDEQPPFPQKQHENLETNADLAAAQTPIPDSLPQNEAPAEERGFSFSKIFGRKSAKTADTLASEEDTLSSPSPLPQQKGASQEEDYYDIPAFLRNQDSNKTQD